MQTKKIFYSLGSFCTPYLISCHLLISTENFLSDPLSVIAVLFVPSPHLFMPFYSGPLRLSDPLAITASCQLREGTPGTL